MLTLFSLTLTRFSLLLIVTLVADLFLTITDLDVDDIITDKAFSLPIETLSLPMTTSPRLYQLAAQFTDQPSLYRHRPE